MALDNCESHAIPCFNKYYMGIALAVRERANCMGRRVGAVIVLDNRIISTGYNGVPEHMDNCLDGGCHRCAHPECYPRGTGYDACICVHAEENALLSAARFGIAIAGGSIYTTLRPCFMCTRQLLQAGIHTVYYLHDWQPRDDNIHEQYHLIQEQFLSRGGIIQKIDMPDPKADWANNIK